MDHPEFFIAAQAGISTIIVGEPGTTKTRTVEAFARFANRDLEVIIPSQREPADICGYPCLQDFTWRNGDGTDHVEKCCEFVPSAWRRRLEHSKNGGVAFFDEVYDCTPSHQAAIQQVLNDGIQNVHGKGVLVCGAGNPAAISTNGYELSAAVVNRLCILQWHTPLARWKHNMLVGFKSSKQSFPVLPDDWEKYLVETRGLVTGFLDAKPDLAQKLPKERSKQGEPWPSIRSWTNAATLLAANMSVGGDEVIAQKLVNGCVGAGASVPFITWQKNLDLPPANMILDNPTMFDWGGRGDKVYAMITGVLGHALGNMDADMWQASWNVLCCAAEKGALAVATSAAKALSEGKPDGVEYPKGAVVVFKPVLEEMLGVKDLA